MRKIILFVGLLLIPLSILSAGMPEDETVTVYVPDDWYPYSYWDGTRLTGFFIDYWQLVQERSGLPVKIVPYLPEQWKYHISMDEGKIGVYMIAEGTNTQWKDLVVELEPLTTAQIPLVMETDLSRLPLNNTLPGGTAIGIHYTPMLKEIVEYLYPDAEIMAISSPADIVKAAEKKKVLVYVPYNWYKKNSLQEADIPRGFSRTWTRSLDMYPVVSIENQATAAMVERAREMVPDDEVDSLKAQWNLPVTNRRLADRFLLTDDEKEWVAGIREIEIVLPSLLFPDIYSFHMKRKNALQPVLNLVFEELFYRLKEINPDLRIEAELAGSAGALHRMEEKEGDIMIGAVDTRANRNIMLLSPPLIVSPIVIVTRSSHELSGGIKDLKEKRVGVLTGGAAAEALDRENFDCTVLEYGNTYQGLTALRLGKIDAWLGDLTSVSLVLQKMEGRDFRIAGTTRHVSRICIGVRKDWPVLAGMLNRYLVSIPDFRKREMFEGLMSDSGRYYINWMGLWKGMAGGAALFLLVLMLIIFWNRKLALEVHNREKAQKELGRVNTALELSNRAKSQFLANMSHEIRTPMNAIIGLTHLCLKTDLDPKQKEYVEKINKSAHSLLGIINDILDFSKIEAGKMSLDKVLFRFDDVLDDMKNILQETARQKGLELVFERGKNVPDTAIGDPLRLGQVILNLLTNAVKFTERGSVKITLNLQERTRQEALIRFEVKDTGMGMTDEQLAGLFQPFVQADGSTSRKFGGTGLGLAICRQLVEMMQGTITAASEFGSGSLFTFTARFPIPDEAMIRDNIEKLKKQSASLSRDQFNHARVLLVEDNEINRQVAREILEDAGIEVDTVVNGREAVDRLHDDSSRYDVVLMDVLMPVMDGYEAVRNIRNVLGLRDLPVIAMTASAMAGDREKSIEAGMNDYISKPIDPARLFEVLGKYIRMTWDTPARRFNTLSVPDKKTLPEQLPGVDVRDGIIRMAGNSDLYVRMAARFRENYGDFINQFVKLIDARDSETLIRSVHTLKSTAGNIGAAALSSMAGKLEAMLRKNPETMADDSLCSLASEMEMVLKSLETLPQPDKEGDSGKVLDKESLLELLEKARPYLKLRKPKQTLELAEQMASGQCDCGVDKDLKQFGEAVKKYRYQDAEELLEKMVKKIHGNHKQGDSP
jgi:signal transduction histidine kinase/CheY-like chemotaxis protein/HPt (histidine-containing phosphotransfer) domain-containing protein